VISKGCGGNAWEVHAASPRGADADVLLDASRQSVCSGLHFTDCFRSDAGAGEGKREPPPSACLA
jgi:hypothetical protein